MNKQPYKFNMWNVDSIYHYKDLNDKFMEMDMIGESIKSIQSLGHIYTFDDFEDQYETLEKPKELKRYIEIDEPIIIELESGRKFEFDCTNLLSLKMGMDSLPENITWGINKPNYNANVIFSNCINKKILDIRVRNTREPIRFGVQDHKMNLYIKRIDFVLEDNIKICFNTWLDYGRIAVYENNKMSKIKYEDLKNGFIQ